MKKQKKKTKISLTMLVFGLCATALICMFYTISFFLIVGMLPSVVAYFTNKSTHPIRTLTVGALNFAGCFPFLIELVHYKNDLTRSLDVLSDPITIVVAYSAAMIGYLVDWAISGLAAGILYQRGLERQKQIKKEQAAFIERWGEKIRGDIPLDEQGFPVK